MEKTDGSNDHHKIQIVLMVIKRELELERRRDDDGNGNFRPFVGLRNGVGEKDERQGRTCEEWHSTHRKRRSDI